MPRTPHPKWRLALPLMAWAALVAAYVIGLGSRGQASLDRLKSFFPESTRFERINASPLIFRLTIDGDPGQPADYLAVGQAHGYGGPLSVATRIDRQGRIKRVIILSHKETPAFLNRVTDNGFLSRFTQKPANAPLVPGDDIQGVSGATVSAAALAQAVRQGSYGVAAQHLSMELPALENRKSVELGTREYVLLLLLGTMLTGAFLRWTWLRYLTLGSSLVFLGFYLNAGLSLANLATLILGYFPSLADKSFWWILVGGITLTTFLYGKNLYCFWLCPGAAIQEATARIGGLNIKLSPKTLRRLAGIRSGLLWCCLIMIFLTSNPSIAAFTPFATLFGLQGSNTQWLLLPVAILGSFLCNRFWCRVFCPVGPVLNTLARLGSRIKKRLNPNHRFQGGSKCDSPF